ncbi:UDP-N-acetylmuramoyl-tripeptide--D-alanyl-D-alanine ligase [Halocola ammonii]
MVPQQLIEKYKQQRKVTTDSRKVSEGDIYFALKGPNFDGNKFAQSALQDGASFAVVDDSSLSGDRMIHVDDVLTALQDLAKLIRSEFTFPVIGITGSNGKTTTKELMRDVLQKKLKAHATKGNLNNHIGVPITILNTPLETELAIIEMGANHVGEIASLCEISQPDYGLITNIGKAHLEGFGGIEGVKKGKSELYKSVAKQGKTIFVNGNDDTLLELSEGQDRIIYGDSTDNLFEIELDESFPTVSFTWKTHDSSFPEISTNLTGGYNLPNISAALAVGIHFGVDASMINEAISEYTPDNNRSQLKTTDKDNLLILDAYNANPTSMEMALRNLSGMRAQRKFFVIGDMLEVGESSKEEHQNIVDLAIDLELDGILVGKEFSKISSPYPTFTDADDAIAYLKERELYSTTILLKGSRGIQLEKVEPIL